jgi:myo-inositol-1-phosphate synthase
MKKIKVALLGIGNCASSLVQGVYYYSDPSRRARGLIHPLIGGHAPSDLSFVLAIDADARKVGRDLADAIFAPPNCNDHLPEGYSPDRHQCDDGPGPRRHGRSHARRA